MNFENLKSSRPAVDFGKVAVLLGGNSAEREISIKSGNAIYEALKNYGIDVVKIDAKADIYDLLQKNKIERVFIALHGRDGEDGVIQGFLKTLNIPFTGTGVSSAAISMDKLMTKRIWAQLGLNTAKFEAIEKDTGLNDIEIADLMNELGGTVFVKPVKEGSSVGMSKVRNADELRKALSLAHQYDDCALVESFIEGDEYTVSILHGVAMPSICMRTPRDFYDYEAKYESNETEYYCPSGLDEKEESHLRHIAMSAFNALGCRGWGRVDFIRCDKTRKFFLLEANTVPGMTESSLVPKSAKVAGLDFQELVLSILETSFQSNESRADIHYLNDELAI